MENNDLISIIIPVYKVEKYLKKCVDSILRQTYKNIEIILVDDGSPDECGKICDKYAKLDDRIKVIHKENGGLSDARNVGIAVSSGKYITFVDSDDYVELDYIEYLYDLIIKYNVNISFCKYTVIYQGKKTKIVSNSKSCKCTKEEALKEMLYAKDFEVSAWGKMYLRTHFDDVKYPKGKIFEDNDTTYKVVDKNENVALGYSAKYNYVMHNNSITKSEFTDKHMYLIEATDNMCDYLEKYKELLSAIKRKRFSARISTLNRMINSSNRNKKEEKKLRKEILKYKCILRDNCASSRDKISILILRFGLGIYKKCWNIYEKITGRK